MDFNMMSPIKAEEAGQKNPLVLAYIGDTVFDLYVRDYIVKNKNGLVNALNQMACKLVNARAQAGAVDVILPLLEEEEVYVFKRGRNAKSSTVPKNMTLADYKKATGLEALVGYLYLCGMYDRLDFIMKRILEISEKNHGEESICQGQN